MDTHDHIQLWVTDFNSLGIQKIDDVCFLLLKLKFSSPIYATYDTKGRKLQAFGKSVLRKIFQQERLTKTLIKVLLNEGHFDLYRSPPIQVIQFSYSVAMTEETRNVRRILETEGMDGRIILR
jgi:hypothetical protein